LSGRDAVPPPNPTKDGYDFDGWDGDYTNVTSNRTITTKWKEQTQTPTEQYYTVTFTVDGNAVSSQQVLSGGNATPPANPTKTGYIFDGWDGSYTNVTSNRTVTAKWKEQVQYYTVTFLDGQGGNVIGTPQSVQRGGSASAPANPTKTGYEFKGWVGNYANVTENRTVYADWQKIEQTIPPFNYPSGTMNVSLGGKGDIMAGYINDSVSTSNIGDVSFLFFNQSKNLSAGYNAVADEYGTQNPKYRLIANAEDAYRIKMKTVNDAKDYAAALETNIDGILDNIFGNSGSARTAFDSEFNASKRPPPKGGGFCSG
jgi:uncharacterized repeat protein (TIGR02543 family)